MKSTAQFITFLLAVVAGILAIETAPLSTVFAFLAGVSVLIPRRKPRTIS